MFDDILHRKTAFLDLKKTLILKTRNKCIFPRGLVHGFGKNELKFFHFIIYEIHQRKCVWRYSGSKKLFFDSKSMAFKKSKNLLFSKGASSRFCSKIYLFISFLEKKKDNKIGFDDILDRKLENKIIDFQKSKKLHFFIGFNPRFSLKI